jgi:hypothetical protein
MVPDFKSRLHALLVNAWPEQKGMLRDNHFSLIVQALHLSGASVAKKKKFYELIF